LNSLYKAHPRSFGHDDGLFLMPFLEQQKVFSLADIADVADFLHFSIVISNIMFIFAARKKS
jgi:hypothetical protein